MLGATGLWQATLGKVLCIILLAIVMFGCDADTSLERQPSLWVELDGTNTNFGMLPAFYASGREGGYDWCKWISWKADGMRYQGMNCYQGPVTGSPEHWQLLLAVYGGAREGESQLQKLTIKTTIQITLKMHNMDKWQVALQHNGNAPKEIKDTLELAPGKYEFGIQPQ